MTHLATEHNVHDDGTHSPYLAHHFDDLEQQKECATLGMWLFLATEVLLFGGVFCAYIIYRRMYYQAWTIGSDRLNPYLGTLNTVILLTSSFFVVMAVHAAHRGDHKGITRWLLLTIVLGLSFLVVKGFEYHKDYRRNYRCTHSRQRGNVHDVLFCHDHDPRPAHDGRSRCARRRGLDGSQKEVHT